MNELLKEFKEKTIRYLEENPKLLALDEKIAKLEEKIKGVEFQEEVFFLRKRLGKLEINKFGYSLDTDDNDNGKN